MYHHCFNYSLCSAAVDELWHSLNKDLSLTLIPSRVFTVRQLAETAAAVAAPVAAAAAAAAAITAVRASGFDIHVEWRRHICVSLQECVGASDCCHRSPRGRAPRHHIAQPLCLWAGGHLSACNPPVKWRITPGPQHDASASSFVSNCSLTVCHVLTDFIFMTPLS